MNPDSLESRVGRLEQQTHGFMGRIDATLTEIRGDVGEIKEQTTKTNGRVTEIELREKIRAAVKQGQQQESTKIKGWVMGVLGVVGIASGGLVTALISKLIG